MEKKITIKQLQKNYKLYTKLKSDLIKLCKIENIRDTGIHLEIYKNKDNTYDLCILLSEEEDEN